MYTVQRMLLSQMQKLAEKVGHSSQTGGRLNKKDGLTRYGNSHVKDKTS